MNSSTKLDFTNLWREVEANRTKETENNLFEFATRKWISGELDMLFYMIAIEMSINHRSFNEAMKMIREN